MQDDGGVPATNHIRSDQIVVVSRPGFGVGFLDRERCGSCGGNAVSMVLGPVRPSFGDSSAAGIFDNCPELRVSRLHCSGNYTPLLCHALHKHQPWCKDCLFPSFLGLLVCFSEGFCRDYKIATTRYMAGACFPQQRLAYAEPSWLSIDKTKPSDRPCGRMTKPSISIKLPKGPNSTSKT